MRKETVVEQTERGKASKETGRNGRKQTADPYMGRRKSISICEIQTT